MIEFPEIYRNGKEAKKAIKLCTEVYKIKKEIGDQKSLDNLEVDFQIARDCALSFEKNISKYPISLN